jgi:hypothetical protein
MLSDIMKMSDADNKAILVLDDMLSYMIMLSVNMLSDNSMYSCFLLQCFKKLFYLITCYFFE